MSKAEQVLTIEPQNELKFRGPFNVPVTSYMKLSNPSDRKVLFKIKTTAPKKYYVRPNSGLLDPDSHIEIAICLQPFIFDPSEKNNNKLMVQTVFAPPEGEGNVNQLWKDVNIDQMITSILKCVFELPAELNVSGQEEVVKASPKAPLQAAISSATTNESELEKAAVEVQQLREEMSSLRQEKNKNEFIVQTVFAPPEGKGNVHQLWKNVTLDQMKDSKLKCVFKLPAELNVSGQEKVVKTSPKALPLQAATSSATTNESELEKAAVEVQQLREEESSLKQGNLHVKKEVLLHLALGITLAIFGIILGKFIL